MTSPELLAHVKRSEELRLDPYLDPIGLPTIGYGHRIASLDHPRLTEPEADALLMADLAEARRNALLLAPNLSGPRLDALTDLVFNVGAGPALRTSGTVAALRAGDWPMAAKKFRQWNKARNPKTGELEPLPGLTSRREIGALWIEQG